MYSVSHNRIIYFYLFVHSLNKILCKIFTQFPLLIPHTYCICLSIQYSSCVYVVQLGCCTFFETMKIKKKEKKKTVVLYRKCCRLKCSIYIYLIYFNKQNTHHTEEEKIEQNTYSLHWNKTKQSNTKKNTAKRKK